MKPERQLLPLFTTASGRGTQLHLYRYKGHKPGKKVHIQAAIHAAEVQGVAVVHQLATFLATLDPTCLHGSITLLPLANPFAIDLKVGEHTPGPLHLENGLNWNRCYRQLVADYSKADGGLLDADAFSIANQHPSQEVKKEAYRKALTTELEKQTPAYSSLPQKQADILLRHALSCDLVLDLHTSTDGVDFAYGPNIATLDQDCGMLGVAYGLRMPAVFGSALDEALQHAWAPLRTVVDDADLIPKAFTLEYGGQEHIDLQRAQTQAEHLLNYLRYAGVLHDQPTQAQPLAHIVDDHLYTAIPTPEGGFCQWHVAPGDKLEAGTAIASLLCVNQTPDLPTRVLTVHTPQAGIVLNRYPSAVVNQGAPLIKLIPLPSEQEAH